VLDAALLGDLGPVVHVLQEGRVLAFAHAE
jgi:hypothetical protein